MGGNARIADLQIRAGPHDRMAIRTDHLALPFDQRPGVAHVTRLAWQGPRTRRTDLARAPRGCRRRLYRPCVYTAYRPGPIAHRAPRPSPHFAPATGHSTRRRT